VKLVSRRRVLGVTGLLSLSALLFGGVPAASAGATVPVPNGAPSVHFLSNATVRGTGAAALVQLAVRCAPSVGSFVLELSVRQRGVGGTVVANGFATGACTGARTLVTAPVESGAVPEDAPFDVNDRSLSPGAATAQAYTLLCDVNGCTDVLYRPQHVTLTASARLDRLTASDGQTTYTIGTRWRLTPAGTAAVATVHITCPAGVSVPLDSLDLWSASTPGHVQQSTAVVSFPPPPPTVRCNGRPQKTRVRLFPVNPVPGQALHGGVGLAHFFVNDVEAWGQVRLVPAASR
jgi:hypothetical protein